MKAEEAAEEEDHHGHRLPAQSIWVARFLSSSSSSGGGGGIETQGELSSSTGLVSMEGSSLRRSQSWSEFWSIPRDYKRTQDCYDGDDLQRYLLSHSLPSWPLICSPKTNNEESRSDDSQNSSDAAVLGLDSSAPLPYSSFMDQRNGRSRNQRPRAGTEHSGNAVVELVEQPRNSLFTPIFTPFIPRGLGQHEVGDSTSFTNFDGEDAAASHEDFVHQKSVLNKPYSILQPQLNVGNISSEWLSRWSASGEGTISSSEENVLKLRSCYVPSAAALAIVGKSSINLQLNSSSSNSRAAWQSDDADSGDAVTSKSSNI